MELGKIPLELKSSTIPVLRTQVSASVTVSPEAIHVEAVEDFNGQVWPLISGGREDSEIFEFDLATRASVQAVRVSPDASTLTILHDDPYGVEEAFHTVFTSHQSYWIKAFAKMLKDRFRIEVEFEVYPNEGFSQESPF